MPRSYSSARGRILDAAEEVILKGGLSVDAVLRESGMSKGGFFHHFASMEALLGAVTERLAAQVAGDIESLASQDKQPRGRRLRAHVRLALELPPGRRRRLQALVLALVAAAKESPAIAAAVRADNRRALKKAAAERVPVGRALVVQLALDGYWLGESLGTLALDAKQKVAFAKSLMELLR